MSKPRSPLLTMPEAAQAQLADWLLGGMNYHAASELCSKEFGVTVKSTSGFSNFWTVVCEPALLARRARAVKTANAIGQTAEQSNQLDSAIVAQIKQKSFEVMIKPHPNPKELAALLSLCLKVGDQEIEKKRLAQSERRLKLLEERQATTKAVIASSLSPEEKQAALQEIYGPA